VDTAEKRYGEALKKARARVGISQEELADRADVHASYVSQLERGIKSPTLGVMLRLAGALGLPAADLLRETEQEYLRRRK